MFNLTKRFHHLPKSALLLVMLIIGGLLLPGVGAFADTPVVNGTVNAGSLSETASGPYSFTGTPGTTATYTMPFSVSDTTGGAAGWNITITSTTLTYTSHTIPATASTITAVSNVCTAGGAAGVNCMQSPLTNTVTPPIAVPAATTAPTAVKFFSIAAAAASGVYTITPTISVVIPAVTFLAAYSSTVTLSIVSGP
jgi:hypothetical protein